MVPSLPRSRDDDPSDDGGYYLIGVRALHRELFEALAWSTSSILPETVRRAEALGLKLAWLPTWFDIDTPEDLQRLRTTLAQTEGMEPQQTWQFFGSVRNAEIVRDSLDDSLDYIDLKYEHNNHCCPPG